MNHFADLAKISTSVRQSILKMTTQAGSGHPTSSLSAVELMVGLLFGQDGAGQPYFNCDWQNFEAVTNDRLLFSKGHASPLFFGLFYELGLLSEEELMGFRTFKSALEGHPTPKFAYTLATTGSLGQGLGIGLGIAIANQIDKLNAKTWVLLGDSEMAEGSNWEAMQLASHRNVSNLIGIIDLNRLGQRGETMIGWDIETLSKRVESMGWEIIQIQDGHNSEQVDQGFELAISLSNNGSKPTMIIANTIKGKGISFLENKEDWHGKVLDSEQLERALSELE